MVERMLSVPNGTEIEIRAPIFKIHGEDYAYLFDQIRTNGYRYVMVDKKKGHRPRRRTSTRRRSKLQTGSHCR